MVSSSIPDHMSRGKCNIPKSHFQQTVCLADWWLFKSENDFQGRRLAVAGFTSRAKQAMRVFSSAPILKRYDVFTLETSDGICVILKGFINKVRTAENGFPSDVYNHFVFGFPTYWKEYAEKFMDKEFPSDISGVNLLKKPPTQSETVEDGQPQVDNCEKDFGSQEKRDVKGMCKSKKSKSSAVPFPQFNSVISGSVDNLNMSIASGGLEKESFSGGSTVEEHTTFDMPVNCLKNTMKSLSDSSFGENINISAVSNKIKSDLDVGSVRDEFEQISETLYQVKSLRKVKTKGNMLKAKQKSTRTLSTPAAADYRKGNVTVDKNSLSGKAKQSDIKTRRKLAYETPDLTKEKGSIPSPQSLSFNRSRSGRLLMPMLEFWRNQRAIYDADRTITGIEEDRDSEQPRKGCGSRALRKRKATNLRGSQ